MATISDNLQVVRERIARAARTAGRDPVSVTLLAVSKSQPVARIEEARAAGHKAFGENYVQEALEKMDALPGLEWHLIGPLQSNKTRLAAERFAWVHTLEREKIARRLSEQRPAGLPPLELVVRTSGEVRVSNFLLWQLAYAEIHLTETLWPDFGEEALLVALDDFQNRERRFGQTSAQIRRAH